MGNYNVHNLKGVKLDFINTLMVSFFHQWPPNNLYSSEPVHERLYNKMNEKKLVQQEEPKSVKF